MLGREQVESFARGLFLTSDRPASARKPTGALSAEDCPRGFINRGIHEKHSLSQT